MRSPSKKTISGLKKELSVAVNNVLKADIYKDVNVGIEITTVNGKHVLYKNDNIKPYITASAFKIIPSAIALIKFGIEYKFKTPVYIKGEIINKVLKGDLYIKGKGDPSLNIKNLRNAVKKLKDIGIKKIDGNIYYDTSYLDKEGNRYAPNARNLYAPPSALTVNYNWIDVKINDGPPVVLKLIPDTSYAKLTYDIEISFSTDPHRPLMIYKKYPWGDHYTIKGSISRWDKQYHYVWLGVSRPGLYAATLLKETCKKMGISLKGRIKEKIVPEDVKLIYEMTSSPLKDAIKVMNQESNNVIAELINKDLGAFFISEPGTREKGLKVLKDFFINNIKISEDKISIGDASGLSVKNLVSANSFVKALNYFYKDVKVREVFLPTLAWQGHHPHARNPVPPDNIKILVKTGTLSVRGVNTVVGYILIGDTNDAYSFAILANRLSPGPMTYSGTLTNPFLISIVDVLKKIYPGSKKGDNRK